MTKQTETGWDSVNKVLASAFVVGIALFGGFYLTNMILANKEANVRIRHNLDKDFFAFLEKRIKENNLLAESFEIHKAIAINQFPNPERFSGTSHRLFNLNDYYFIKLGEGRYLVYRGDAPPLDIESNEVLNLMNYDPSNGTVSVGYHARIIDQRK